MTEIEKLKLICDKIKYNGFKDGFIYNIDGIISRIDGVKCNVREIIFTTEFRDKLRDEMLKKGYQESQYEYHMMMLVTRNLDNSVEFIYNLIK